MLLASVLALGVVVTLTAVSWSVIKGLGDGTESVGLMAIDASERTNIEADPNLAPSRQAPIVSGSAQATAAVQNALVVKDLTAQHAASSASHAASTTAEPPTFDGRPLRKVQTLRMLTTAYSPDAQSCGIHADGITASGYSVWTNGMKLVAADTKLLPFGSIVTIPGYNGGKPVPVLDRGGRIKGNRLDLLYPTHELALIWGAQRLEVDVWAYADESP